MLDFIRPQKRFPLAVTRHALRGGAALMIAALAAEGTTVIDRIDHIDRGYEHPEVLLRELGANIQRIQDDEV